MSLERLRNQSDLMLGKMWEDPEVERQLMWEDNARRVLCVASAGDTALALAAGRGVRVRAFDTNPAQIHLCRLKQALLNVGTLPTAMHSDARRLLAHVEPFLEDDTRAFWQQYRDLLKSGLSMVGRVDHVMGLFARLFRLLLSSDERVMKLLETRHPALQKVLFQEEWDGRKWRWAFRLAFHPWILRMFFGRELVKDLPKGLSDRLRIQTEKLLTLTPAYDNPYLWQTFLPHRPDAPRPAYLQNFGTVDFQVGDVGQITRRGGKYDFFALSNILENASPSQCSATLAALRTVARPRAIAVLRFTKRRPPVWPEARSLPGAGTKARTQDRAYFFREVQVYQL